MKAKTIKSSTRKVDASRERLRRAAKEYRNMLKTDPIERVWINVWSRAKLSEEG